MNRQAGRQFSLYSIDDVNVSGYFSFISCLFLYEEFGVCVLVV